MAHRYLLQQHSPPLLFLQFEDHYKVLIKIPPHIYGKEVGGTTTLPPAMIKQIKENPWVNFRSLLSLHFMILMTIDSECGVDKTKDYVEDW